MTDIEKEMRQAAQSVSRSNGQPERHDFVSLADKVALVMVQAAEDQVTEAQNKLREIQAWANTLTQEVKDKDRELADMTNRIAAFGDKVLRANEEFHAAVTDRDTDQNQPRQPEIG